MKRNNVLLSWLWVGMFVLVASKILLPQQSTAALAISPDLTLIEAVKYTLANHTLLQIQQEQITINRGLRQQAAGQFDTLLGAGITRSRSNDPLSTYLQQQALTDGVQTSNLLTNLTTYDMNLGKMWRNGASVSAVLGVSRDLDNLTNAADVSSSQFSLVLEIPLLRGRGRDAVAAQEDAAGIEVQASRLDLNQLIAQLMANTATSYWNFVAARKNLQIAQDAEQRGHAYVENVQAFIEADRVPRSDIHEVVANLAGRTATRIAAEHQVIAAANQLALDMGLLPNQVLSITGALDNFPDSQSQQPPSDEPQATREYFEESLHRRADFLAAKSREAEARRLLSAARNQTLPSLNLSSTTGYNGLRQGHALGALLGAPFADVPGVNAGVGITYSFPPRNDLARGQLLQSQAALSQSELRTTSLAESIHAAVYVAADAVWSTIEQSRKAHESVASFQSGLAAEREKYRLGIGSVVDILTVEDSLTTALLSEVQADLAYAAALTQLRLATGTLVDPDKPVQTVEGSVFFRVP
jgi:outer membrane protein